MMQFWQIDTITVAIIIIIGLIITFLLTANMMLSRGAIRREKKEYSDYGGWQGELMRRVSIPARVSLPFFLGGTIILGVIATIGIVYFFQGLWANPIYINSYDLNLVFIFIIVSCLVFFISFAVAASRSWAKNIVARGGL
jgi:hypothetical protein